MRMVKVTIDRKHKYATKWAKLVERELNTGKSLDKLLKEVAQREADRILRGEA